jgi:hypothetical protein
MFKFIFGVIFGIIVSTIGFQGLAVIADHAMVSLKHYSEESVKEAKESR